MEKYLEKYPDVLDIKDIAAILSVSTNTVRRLIKDGRLDFIKVGRLIKIPKDRLLDFLNGSGVER